MLITGIKSRPLYKALEPDLSGSFHLLFGQGQGGSALMRILPGFPDAGAVRIIFVADELDGSMFQGVGGAADVRICPAEAEAVAELDRSLAKCVMGTRLYIAGSESFIGTGVQVAMKYGLGADEVQREQCGSAARRVYCIHCNTSNENVRTNICPCAGCGRHLLVRDHYSRRLAAYMGVMADAEAPGRIPPIEEAF